MNVLRRVFVSLTYDSHLTESQNKVKWGIVKRVMDEGYTPHLFFPSVPPEFAAQVQREMPWSAERVEEAIQGSVGAVLIGYPRWRTEGQALASEYTHYEAGVARTVGVPMFMVLEQGTTLRGAYDPSSHQICDVPAGADASWLSGPHFEQSIGPWLDAVRRRFDVFLAYSSKAQGTASNLKRALEDQGAKVLDWRVFGPGTILEQIKKAAACCSGGIFLFTADDDLEGEAGKAAPRDNVVFEAGYFVHAKGQKRVLIVLETGDKKTAKMPADLGGAIYAPLPDRANIEALEGQLKRFLQEL